MAKGSKVVRKGSLGENSFDAIHIGAVHNLTSGLASVASGAMASDVAVVRIFCTKDVYLKISAIPSTATTSDMYMPAGVVEYFGISSGEEVSALQVISAGVVNITEGES